MAGEMEEPFGLEFRVDSVHSGSISFGRFESEALCWERRSSFTHNRYLEEVEKCSKPGSVTEKKAYFEAHFRKKGFFTPDSPKCQNETYYETSGNGAASDSMLNDGGIACSNVLTHSAQFDKTMDGSAHGGDHQVTSCETQVSWTSCYQPHLEHTNDGDTNVESVPEHAKVDRGDDVEPGSSFSEKSTQSDHDHEMADLETKNGSNMATGLSHQIDADQETSSGSLEDQQNSGSKESVPLKLEHINPRVVPRLRIGQSRTYPQRITSKGSENNSNQKAKNAPVRSTMGKKTSDFPEKCLMYKSTKHERGSKSKGADEINRAGKESRTKNIVEPQSSIPQKVSGRVYQSTNRSKVTAAVTKPGVRQDICRSSFKCDEHAPRSNVAIAANSESKQLHAKSSVPGTRPSKNPPSAKVGPKKATSVSMHTTKADPPETSGITSCQWTAISDSGASSHALTSNQKHRNKEAGKEKNSSLCKHRVAEGNVLHKGRSSDGRQNARVRKSSFESFSSSSRAAAHMAIHVAS